MVLKKVQTKTNCWFDVSIQAIAKSIQIDMKKEFGVPKLKTLMCSFSNGVLSWYVNKNEWTRCEYIALDIILKDPSITPKLKKKFLSRSKIFERLTKKLGKTDFSKLTDMELLKLHKKYSTEYQALTILGEPLALYVRDKLTEHLEKELKNKSKDLTKDINFLVLPNYLNFVKREEIDMLKLAMKAKKSNLDKLIKAHTKKYFWIPFDYGVMIWHEKHFMNEYKKVKNPRKELANIEKYYKDLKREQKALEKKLGINKYISSLIEAQKILAVIMDYKKEVFTRGHYAVEPLSREIAKRLDLTFDQMRCLMNRELYICLEGKKKPDKKLLNERIKFSVVKLNEEGDYVYTSGKKAREIYNKKLNPKVSNVKIIKGRPASKGKYRGKVRLILDARNIHRVKKGEVLVTYMTSPDYTIGMKKAGAFVTDEGGLTCHAAIVAREMNKPCVIGTKIATKVLKNGDIVEVDANKGVVRKI